MNDFFKKYGRNAAMDIAMVVVFLLISFVYFQTPITQGMELGGHDSDAAMNQGREQADYRASHDGETSRWTNAMFSGMPLTRLRLLIVRRSFWPTFPTSTTSARRALSATCLSFCWAST